MEHSGQAYIDQDGFKIAVGAGMGQSSWFTKRFLPGRSGTRVKTPALPHRDDPETAQKDLDEYAAKKGWKKLEETNATERQKLTVNRHLADKQHARDRQLQNRDYGGLFE